MLLTDHGRINTGHGKNSPSENSVSLIIHSRLGISGVLIRQPAAVDTVVTVLGHLGVPIGPAMGHGCVAHRVRARPT